MRPGFRVIVAMLSGWICFGQPLSIGVTGGERLSDDVTGATPESRRYVVGPTIELELPWRFAVEADALYRRNGYQVAYGNFAYSVVESERANSWEFPMLLQYRLPLPKVKPFVEVGVAPRTISGAIAESGFSVNIMTGQRTPLSDTQSTNWSASVGVVVGGGVRFGLGRLRFSPEVRYTHWTSTPINGYFSDGPSYYSTQEQVDVLIGIGWKIH